MNRMLYMKSKLPKYKVISDQIRADIENGNYPPYSQLPSEKDLARHYDVSVQTVRSAFLELSGLGLIEKAKGKKSVVCPPKDLEPIFVLQHDNTGYQHAHEQVTYQLIHQDLIPPTNKARQKLQLSWTTEKVIRISRVRKINEKSVSFYITYLNPLLCEALLDERLGNRSLVKTMRETYGLIPQKMLHEFEIKHAEMEVANRLQVAVNSSVLELESVEYNSEEVPFSYNVEYYSADRYRFQLQISLPEDSGNVK